MLGAGALLVWGLRLIKTGMLRAFGASLRNWIGKSTSNRVYAMLVGIVATLAVQSSTAMAIIIASFAARELISGIMAQAVMLGANIGTSLTAAVLSLDLHWLSPLLILIGVVTFSRSRRGRGKGIGRAILGLGLMLLALSLLRQTTTPFRESELVVFLLSGLDNAPVFALIFATGLAFVASSSLAVVLFIVLIAQTGIISPALALVLVAGANLGGAIPPYLAVTSEGVQARRITLTNLAIRGVGAVLLTIAAPWLAPTMSAAWPETGAIALAAHIGFSLVLMLVFLPLLSPLSRLIERIMPLPKVQPFGPQYLDESALQSPPIALSAAARETLRLGDLVRDMLEESLKALQTPDADNKVEVARLESHVDQLQGAIKSYLSRLNRDELDQEDMQRATEIMSYAINLEHVGDIIESSLADLAAKKAKRRVLFSPEGLGEITAFYNRTFEILQMAQSVFLSRDTDLAYQLVAAKVEVRQLEACSAENHLERLRAGRTETIETSGMHLDILRDLKGVNAHLISVAYPILHELGALRDTRLRKVQD